MLSRFFEEAKSMAGCSHKMAGLDAWEERIIGYWKGQQE